MTYVTKMTPLPLSGLFGVILQLKRDEVAWKKSRTQGDPLPPLPQDRPVTTEAHTEHFNSCFTLNLQKSYIHR